VSQRRSEIALFIAKFCKLICHCPISCARYLSHGYVVKADSTLSHCDEILAVILQIASTNSDNIQTLAMLGSSTCKIKNVCHLLN
jgi:hypothetical protein